MKKKALVIGGGSGAPNLISGFSSKRFIRYILIPMSDSGGGAAIVGGLFNLPAFSDLDRAVIALAGGNISPEMQILMSHRLVDPVGGDLLRVRTSNFITSIFANHFGNIQKASDAVCRLIGVPRGDRVFPATLVKANLVATLHDGTLVYGEHAIDDPYLIVNGKQVLSSQRVDNPISQLGLVPRDVKPNPEALGAINRADLILIAPGSLYTSILAGLVVPGISEAIDSAAGNGTPVVLVVNLMTEPYQTDHLNTVSSQIREILRFLPCLTHVVVNNRPIPDHLLDKYRLEGQNEVVNDIEGGSYLGCTVLRGDLLGDEAGQATVGKMARLTVLRHNPDAIAGLVSQILGG
jgi:uncharacterized cofD-like protein